MEKGLQVIELILTSHEALSMSQISEALGYKVSETQRTIEYLAAERYLARGVSGAYSPGPKSYGLVDKCRDSNLVARAEGPMRRFALNCASSVHIGVLVDRMLHVVYGIEGGGMVRVGIRPGLYEAADTVSGRLLLAYHEGEQPESSPTRQPEGIASGESAAHLRERGWNWGEVACARGVYIIAVSLAMGGSPGRAVLAAPYLCTGSDTAEPRRDLHEGLALVAREIESFF